MINENVPKIVDEKNHVCRKLMNLALQNCENDPKASERIAHRLPIITHKMTFVAQSPRITKKKNRTEKNHYSN